MKKLKCMVAVCIASSLLLVSGVTAFAGNHHGNRQNATRVNSSECVYGTSCVNGANCLNDGNCAYNNDCPRLDGTGNGTTSGPRDGSGYGPRDGRGGRCL